MKNDFLYAEISNNIAKLIKNEVLKPGERLPSVRMLCREHGISMNTAKRAFLELEGRSLIESKPQSGYFVMAITNIEVEPVTLALIVITVLLLTLFILNFCKVPQGGLKMFSLEFA